MDAGQDDVSDGWFAAPTFAHGEPGGIMSTVDANKVQVTLQKLFPSAPITPDIAAQVASAIQSSAATYRSAGGGFRYYMAQATHSRTIGTHSSFVGNLPLVRASLPLTGDFHDHLVPTIQTGIGVLLPQDRLIASVAMVQQLFPSNTQPVSRVDVITPARAPSASGARFGAFATYLCYAQAGDASPSWYILEGGTAPGVPSVLYPSNGMTWIVNNKLGYTPTTFSKAQDYVSGLLTMSGDEPKTLQILVTDTSDQGPDADPTKPYVSVHVEYEQLSSPSDNAPLALILEAAARLGVIGRAIGMDAGFSEDVIALFDAANLAWLVTPGS